MGFQIYKFSQNLIKSAKDHLTPRGKAKLTIQDPDALFIPIHPDWLDPHFRLILRNRCVFGYWYTSFFIDDSSERFTVSH